MTWTPQLTQDGSYTFFSEEFGETFHSRAGAKAEAVTKFAEATQLRQVALRPQVSLLDVCYGLGYNSATAIATIWQVNPDCQITLYGLELDASVPRAAIAPELLVGWSAPVQQVLQDLAQTQRCKAPGISAQLLLGDARQTLQTLVAENFQADAIFFDPFSPRRCPQLWTLEFFHLTAQTLAPEGRLATYSRSACVRAAMQSVGLDIGTLPLSADAPAHQWADGTIAAWPADPAQQRLSPQLWPLSEMEQQHLLTRAAIPYRDPGLTSSAEDILARQAAEQACSTAESTSSWRRRWGLQQGNRHFRPPG